MSLEKLKKIRNELALEVYEEYNIKDGEIYLKNRKGNKIIETYLEDIYNLSYFYLDRKFSEPLNELFLIGVKPYEFIQNRLKEESTPKQKTESKDSSMSETDNILQAILKSITEVKDKVDNVSNKQDVMQSQIDAHTVSINNWNEKFNETIAMDTIFNEESNANVKKRKMNEEEQSNKGSHSNLYNQTKYKENKINSSSKNNRRREKTQKTVIIGSNEAGKIKAAVKTFDVFVGNLHMETNEQEILNMFSVNHIKIIKYGEIETRLKKARAYRVRINYEDKDKIFNPKIWPKGVMLSKYFEKVETGSYSNNNRNLVPNSSSSPKARAGGGESS